MNACYFGYYAVVQSLLNHPQIDINLRSKDDETAYDFAMGGGHTEIVALLEKYKKVK